MSFQSCFEGNYKSDDAQSNTPFQSCFEGNYESDDAQSNTPFQSCFEPHYEREAKCKVFVTKISFHSYAFIHGAVC